MGYSQGVGGKDNSFPFQNTALPSAQPHFWCPQRISLLWLPTSVTPPLIQAVIGLWSSDQNQDARNFQETKFSFLKFFFMCASKERKEERHNSLAMNCQGSSATPTICIFRKMFSLEVLSMHLPKYWQKDELQ